MKRHVLARAKKSSFSTIFKKLKILPGNDSFYEDKMNFSPTPQSYPLPDPQPPEPHQTILLVDDSGAFRNLLWCQLTALGYHVLTSFGEAEARDILIRQDPEIDLLITDMNMPLTRAVQLAQWFQNLKPGARVLLMSTQANTPGLAKKIGFLKKPFRIETLGEQVREFLEGGSDAQRQKAA
jgi:DNA-binding NtrC family response regulator